MRLSRRIPALLAAGTMLFSAMPLVDFGTTASAEETYLARDPFFNYSSGYNYYESEHFQFIWGNSGDASSVTQDFIQTNAANLEECWDIFMNDLGMEAPSQSVNLSLRDGNHYKTNLYISGTGLSGMTDDWAYMSYDNQGYAYLFCCVGAMQANPPSWVLPHEFGHAVTAHQLGWNSNKFSNAWWESMGNWFREQWLYAVSEKYGFTNDQYQGYGTDFFETYLKNMCFTSPLGRDYYAAWPFLQYLTENPDHLDGYGQYFMRTLLQGGQTDEYPYAMIERLADAPLNDTLGHYAKRMATLDFAHQDAYRKRLDLLLSQGEWNWQQIYTMLELVDGTTNTYAVPTERAPQEAGVNVCPLEITGDTITVTFNGMSDLIGADWRACIVIEDANRQSYYSDLFADGETASLAVPANATAAYLTVAATPDESLWCPCGLTWHTDDSEFNEQNHPFTEKHRYPYKVTIEGAGIKSRPISNTWGAAHSNGGGFVASSATVEASVYVGPNACVLGNATVTGNAVIDGYAIIAERANISGNAYVGDYAMVMGNATVTDNAKVLESACVYGNYRISGEAVAKGIAFCMADGQLSGQGIVDGDYYDDGSNSVSTGTCYGWWNTQTYCSSRPYTDGLYLAYDFDTDSSNIAKERYNSTYAYNMGATWEAERTGATGVLTFDGVDDYLDVDAAIAAFDNVNLQFSTLWRGGSDNQKLFYFGDTSRYCYFTPRNSDGVAALVYNRGEGNVVVAADAALELGQWTLVSVNIEAGKLHLQLNNGSIISSDANNYELLDVVDLSSPVNATVSMVGAGANGDFYNGSVDFFRTYHKNTVQEIINYGQSEDITEQPDAPTKKQRGDVNCDGFVKVDDVILLNRYLTEDVTAVITAQGMINAEMNNDEIVNTSDATAILRVLAALDE